MSTDALHRLHQAVQTMDLPEQKKTATEPQDLRWLGRNMGLRNATHPHFETAAAALAELGVGLVIGA